MPKISVFSSFFPPEIGAASSRIYDMCQGLHAAGYDVEVITAMPNYPTGKTHPDYRGKFFSKEEMHGVTVRRHWIFPSHSDKAIFRLLNMLSIALSVFFSFLHMLRKKPDVVIVQYPPVLLPLSAYLVSKITGAKFIVNVSDLWPGAIHQLGKIKKGWSYRLLLKLEKTLYQSADYCMAQSQEIADYIGKRCQTPCFIYRTGAKCDTFEPKSNYEVEDRPLKIIYAGVLGLAHGILKVCKKIDFKALGTEFHIYGDGFEKQKLLEFVEKNPDRGVFIHDSVPIPEIPELLGKYDAALISQKTKVFGTVPSKTYDAMAAGLPIMFNGCGEGSLIIKNTEAGLVSRPDSPKELKRNILKMQKYSAEKREKMGVNGRQAALDMFDRKDQIQKLLQVMKVLCPEEKVLA
ncbi:glycosyltransferase family 4 protein [Flammeovirgaceae bacterium SG7u.111]|nr:glycosyltransferase family 4 protein [Flammeovirgaceae bacterium SG7u.132]WPO38588.1 glycosyltransferase family 4 protein [Flammeovirgaceae bacterium SG7u.111]